MCELVNANGIDWKRNAILFFFVFFCYRDLERIRIRGRHAFFFFFVCLGHNRHRDRGDKLTKERREFSDKPEVNFLQRVPR